DVDNKRTTGAHRLETTAPRKRGYVEQHAQRLADRQRVLQPQLVQPPPVPATRVGAEPPREPLQWLSRRLGPNPSGWHWGRLHQLRLQHALSIRKPLGMLFDVPALPRSGGLETVRPGRPLVVDV